MLDRGLADGPRMKLPKHFSTMRKPALCGLVLIALTFAILLISGHAAEQGGRILSFVLACFALVCGACLIPGSSRLVVGEEGITLNQILWKQHLRWANVRAFTLIDFDDTGLGLSPAWARYSIGYVVDDEHLPALTRLGRKFHGLYGCHGSLPPVDGMTAEELLRLLNGQLVEARRRERGEWETSNVEGKRLERTSRGGAEVAERPAEEG